MNDRTVERYRGAEMKHQSTCVRVGQGGAVPKRQYKGLMVVLNENIMLQ